MNVLDDSADPSIQRWPISYLLEDYYVAARRYFAERKPSHLDELERRRARVRAEIASQGAPRRRDVRIAWEVAASRRKDDRLRVQCMCWRCGRTRLDDDNQSAVGSARATSALIPAAFSTRRKTAKRSTKEQAVFDRAFELDFYEKGFHAGADPQRGRRRRRVDPAMLQYEPHWKRGYTDGYHAATRSSRVYQRLLLQACEDFKPKEPR
jgi:hypothetical protein